MAHLYNQRIDTETDPATGETRQVLKQRNPVTGVWEEYKPYAPPTPAMYDQRYVDGLKDEIEHWKRMYRLQLQVAQELMQIPTKGT